MAEISYLLFPRLLLPSRTLIHFASFFALSLDVPNTYRLISTVYLKTKSPWLHVLLQLSTCIPTALHARCFHENCLHLQPYSPFDSSPIHFLPILLEQQHQGHSDFRLTNPVDSSVFQLPNLLAAFSLVNRPLCLESFPSFWHP